MRGNGRCRRATGRGILALAGVALLAAPVPAGAQEAPTRDTSLLRARLQAVLDSLAARPAIPGLTLGVALPDGSSFGLAAGRADTAKDVPMTPAALMPQGSVGKTYFGAVALQLVAEGRLDLDAPIARYLDGEAWLERVANADRVTLRQLMNHTSGIVRYEFDPRFRADLTAAPMRTFSPEDRLAYLFDADPPFVPGEGWEYSDTNYILVAMLIEKVTGSTAYAEIRRRVLEPLELRETVPLTGPEVRGLVQGYAGEGNPFGGTDEMLRDGRLAINPQFEWGGGGFASTAEDLARWTRDVQEGRAFPPELLEAYRTGVRAPLGPEASYGLGVIMMELPAGTAWGHSGFWPGYRTEAYYFPGGRFALALQVDTSAPGAFPPAPLAMLGRLAQVVDDALGGVSPPG